MKKLLLLLVCIGGWQFYSKQSEPIEEAESTVATQFSNSGAMRTLAQAKELAKPKHNFKCDGREHCSQMTSYEEAKYFIEHCPNTKMDGDNDGIPCERQFSKW